MIESWNSDDWADWLTRGFEDWCDPEHRLRAFNPPGVLQNDMDVVQQVANIYDSLQPFSSRSSFRAGLTTALINYDEKNIPSLQVLRYMVRLCASIKSVESINAMWTCLKNPRLSDKGESKDSATTRRILYATIAGFSSYPGARWYAENLLEDPQTPPDVLPILLVKLSQSNITMMTDYLKAVGKRMTEQKVADFVRQRLENYIRVIGIPAIAKSLQYLDLSRNRDSDLWFVKALFFEDEAPLGCKLKVGREDYVFNIYIVNDENIGTAVRMSELESDNEKTRSFFQTLCKATFRSLKVGNTTLDLGGSVQLVDADETFSSAADTFRSIEKRFQKLESSFAEDSVDTG